MRNGELGMRNEEWGVRNGEWIGEDWFIVYLSYIYGIFILYL